MKEKLQSILERAHMSFQRGDKIVAEQVYKEALKLLPLLIEKSHIIDINWCIYRLLFFMGRIMEAIPYLELLKQQGEDNEYTYLGYLEEGTCMMILGRHKEALVACEQAIHWAEFFQNNTVIADASIKLAKYYYQQGEMQKAMHFFCEASHYARMDCNVRMEALALIFIARIHHKNGNLNIALELLRDAEDLIVDIKDALLVYQAEIKRLQIYMEKKDYEQVHNIINNLDKLNEPN